MNLRSVAMPRALVTGIVFLVVLLCCATSAQAATNAPPQQAADVLKVTLFPSEGNVDELNPLHVTLHVGNPSNRLIAIDRISLLSPAYLTLNGKPPSVIRIAPGESVDIALTLRTNVAVPGTYALVLELFSRFAGTKASWEPAFAQGKVTIGIPGIGDAMQFLGIPSLLLLPGILMIITFAALFGALTHRPAIDAKQPILLVIAVLLSFLTVPIYPWFTRLTLGVPRNYLHGYDLEDVIYLWTMSIVLGAVVAIIAAAIDRWLWNRQPHETDKPIVVLRKLSSRRVSEFRLAGYRKRPANEGGPVGPLMLALPFGKADDGKMWLVPRVRPYRIKETPSAHNRIDRIGQILESFDNPQNKIPDADGELLRTLRAGLAASEIRLIWDNGETFGPRQAQSTDYQTVDGDTIVFVGPELAQ
jgi:hypothetical protein